MLAVLNWLGGSESQDALSEVLAGITSPLDTEFFCRSAHSAAMYAVTSMVCAQQTIIFSYIEFLMELNKYFYHLILKVILK